MKKLLVLGVVGILTVALVGCGKKDPELLPVDGIVDPVVVEEIETVGEVGYPIDELLAENEGEEMELIPGTETITELEDLAILIDEIVEGL